MKAWRAPVSTSEVGARDEDGARSSEDEQGALAGQPEKRRADEARLGWSPRSGGTAGSIWWRR